MSVHACNQIIWWYTPLISPLGRQRGFISKFKARLIYVVNSRLVKAIIARSVSKNKKRKKHACSPSYYWDSRTGLLQPGSIEILSQNQIKPNHTRQPATYCAPMKMKSVFWRDVCTPILPSLQ